jgi:ABC-type xylose transport system permease subunit
MSAEGLFCFVFGFLVPLAIGVVAMKLKNPKLLAVIAGLMVGGLMGFCIFGFWLTWTGNLMMGADEYERRKSAITAIGFLFVIFTALLGALIGFLQNLVVALIGFLRNPLDIQFPNRKLLVVILGLMVGALLGFFVALLWAAWSGNLTMPGEEYVPRKAPTATFILIISCTGILGALLALMQTRKWKNSHEISRN